MRDATTPNRTAGPRRLARLVVSSSAASVVDLLTLFTLINLLPIWPGAAGAAGCIAGGAVNFLLNRNWVFTRRSGGWLGQLLRYGLLVVLGGALVAGTMIHVGIVVLGLPVLLAKGVSAALVLTCWNYPISARLVFRKECNLVG